MGDEIMIQ